MSTLNNRVVVTGVGVVCPLGLDVSTTWDGLIAGRSGIDYITRFDAESFVTKFAGEVKGFEPTDYMSRKDAYRMDRFAQLAVAASRQALEQAGLEITPNNQNDVGVIVGSGVGGLDTLSRQIKVMLEKGPDKVSPFLVPMMAPNMGSAQVSITIGARGPNYGTTSACSSGSDAVGVAYEVVKHGNAQVMIAGGSEALVTPIVIAAFNTERALSTRNSEPQLASRPFDAERDGFVVGEGAGVLILESLSFARERGANIMAEMVGYGATGDAYHITQPAPDGEGAVRAIEIALHKAGLTPGEVDYINAHGTSTPLNDRVETQAIKTVFGDDAYRIPISSTKSMIGHLLGGAGGVEAAVCVLVIKHGIIPPTINLTHPDPECDLDYVPNVARRAKVTAALSNSLGFGGHNSMLAFRQYLEV